MVCTVLSAILSEYTIRLLLRPLATNVRTSNSRPLRSGPWLFSIDAAMGPRKYFLPL